MISLLTPTRKRPDSIRRLTDSVMATASGPVEIVWYIDFDDMESMSVVYELSGETRPASHVVCGGPRIVMGQMWNECYRLSRGDIVMQCADDIVFRTQGWDDRVHDAFDAVPDHIVLVHGEDGYWGGRHATHGFLHRRWVEAVGHVVPGIFSCDYTDAWITEVADALGRRVFLPDVVTEHMHPAFGKAELDESHRERMERGRRDNVDQLYRDTAAERTADVEKLRRLMA